MLFVTERRDRVNARGQISGTELFCMQVVKAVPIPMIKTEPTRTLDVFPSDQVVRYARGISSAS